MGLFSGIGKAIGWVLDKIFAIIFCIFAIAVCFIFGGPIIAAILTCIIFVLAIVAMPFVVIGGFAVWIIIMMFKLIVGAVL